MFCSWAVSVYILTGCSTFNPIPHRCPDNLFLIGGGYNSPPYHLAYIRYFLKFSKLYLKIWVISEWHAKNYEYRSTHKNSMRFQSWQLFSPCSEIEPGYIVKNHDFMNWKLHKSVVSGPIFPNSFATVKLDQYMNCQSIPRVVDV